MGLVGPACIVCVASEGLKCARLIICGGAHPLWIACPMQGGTSLGSPKDCGNKRSHKAAAHCKRPAQEQTPACKQWYGQRQFQSGFICPVHFLCHKMPLSFPHLYARPKPCFALVCCARRMIRIFFIRRLPPPVRYICRAAQRYKRKILQLCCAC